MAKAIYIEAMLSGPNFRHSYAQVANDPDDVEALLRRVGESIGEMLTEGFDTVELSFKASTKRDEVAWAKRLYGPDEVAGDG